MMNSMGVILSKRISKKLGKAVLQTKDKENEGRTYSFNTFDLMDDGHVDISANKLELLHDSN